MSLTEISVRVALVTVFAVGALVTIGWRRPASHYPRRVRGPEARPPRSDENASTRTDSGSTHITGGTAPRKLFDILGLGSIAVFIGIMTALITSLAIARLVTALLARL